MVIKLFEPKNLMALEKGLLSVGRMVDGSLPKSLRLINGIYAWS